MYSVLRSSFNCLNCPKVLLGSSLKNVLWHIASRKSGSVAHGKPSMNIGLISSNLRFQWLDA
jgi:hypothetical protein